MSPRLSPEIFAGQEDRHYAVQALDGAVDSFVGDGPSGALSDAFSNFFTGGLFGRDREKTVVQPTSASVDATPSNAEAEPTPSRSRGLVLSGDTLSAGGVVFKTVKSEEIMVGVRADWPSDRVISPFARAALGRGRGEYDLPDGAGVFTDPINIEVRSRIAEAEAGLQALASRDVHAIRAHLRAGLSVGLRQTRARLHVRSALLDVTDDTTLTEPFAGLRLAVGAGPKSGPTVELGAQARIYDLDRAVLRLGLVAGF